MIYVTTVFRQHCKNLRKRDTSWRAAFNTKVDFLPQELGKQTVEVVSIVEIAERRQPPIINSVIKFRVSQRGHYPSPDNVECRISCFLKIMFGHSLRCNAHDTDSRRPIILFNFKLVYSLFLSGIHMYNILNYCQCSPYVHHQ